MKTEDVYDLKQLFALREALDMLEVAAPPTAHILFPQTAAIPRRVGIFPGSFNPLTVAHTELARRACTALRLDRVFFTLAKVTVDKEQVTGLSLADRLLLLTLYAQQHNDTGVTLVNRGLYFEQAQAFRSLWGVQTELHFVVGMDKLRQIFDPRYYQDRDAVLRQLFSLASLIVANRGEMDQEDFRRFLDQPENRAYRSHVHFLALPTTVAELSATAIRAALATGKRVQDQVTEETVSFLAETRAYDPPLPSGDETLDVYATRLVLLDLLYPVRSWAEQEIDFRHLLHLALTPGEKQRALRRVTTGIELTHLIRSWGLSKSI